MRKGPPLQHGVEGAVGAPCTGTVDPEACQQGHVAHQSRHRVANRQVAHHLTPQDPPSPLVAPPSSLPCPARPTLSHHPGLGSTLPAPSMGPVAGVSPNSNLYTLLSPTLAFTPQLRAKFRRFPEPTLRRAGPASSPAPLRVPPPTPHPGVTS